LALKERLEISKSGTCRQLVVLYCGHSFKLCLFPRAALSTEVLLTHARSNIDLLWKDMATMQHGVWLNDEVINIYMSLLQERDRRRRAEVGLGVVIAVVFVGIS
jgi:hypothetical protein